MIIIIILLYGIITLV